MRLLIMEHFFVASSVTSSPYYQYASGVYSLAPRTVLKLSTLVNSGVRHG